MERYILKFPTIEYKERAIEYVKEFGDEIANGSGGLQRFINNGDTYENWLIKINEDKNREYSETKVPTLTMFLIDTENDEIVGIINIRLMLNAKLRESNGNIGYSIKTSKRRMGLNKINLYKALVICKEYGLEEVMLDCDKTNLGSSKTIRALGGVLEKEYFSEEYNTIVEKFWINVSESVEKYKDLYNK